MDKGTALAKLQYLTARWNMAQKEKYTFPLFILHFNLSPSLAVLFLYLYYLILQSTLGMKCQERQKEKNIFLDLAGLYRDRRCFKYLLSSPVALFQSDLWIAKNELVTGN